MNATLISKALEIALDAHRGQVRKSTSIPYISHPLAVASIAMEYGANQDQVIAALLHDAIEDGGESYRNIIRNNFGEHVLSLVEACTDGTPDATGQKAPWTERKTRYLNHLEDASDDVLLVSGSDKLHNARAILRDLKVLGVSVFNRFSTSQEQTIWYYESLSDIFTKRQQPFAVEIAETISEIKRLSNTQMSS
jgi:(p)ppGpp synthase/HD superfamily hydrolase